MTQHNGPNIDNPQQGSTNTPSGGSADTRNPDWDSYATHGHGRTDEQVRADVQQLLIDESESIGKSSRALSISVESGIVTLEGEVKSEAVQQHLTESIRAIPSVREVRTKLRIAST